MIPLSSKVSSQIRFLLRSLNDSNSDAIFQELCKWTMDDLEGSILLVQTCLDHLIIYDKDLKNMKPHPIYASVFKHILDKPNFSTVLCESLGTALINIELLQNLSGALDLSVSEKIGICLALSNSESHDIRTCGKNFCMAQIAELCANPVPSESTEKIQRIIMFLSRSEGLSKNVDSFMQMLSLVQSKDGAQFTLSPFFPEELHTDNYFRHLDSLNDGGEDDFDAILAEMEKEFSMADMMCELGYGCTANVSQCKEILSLFLPLSDATVAKILGTIARTCAGLDDGQNLFAAFRSALGRNSVLDPPSVNSWNVEILVESINQLVPGINWINVMEKLDHEGFYIPNEESFSFFMSVYRHACQDPFPLHAICGFVWKNVEGQLSFLKYAVSMPPEVFTFAHSGRLLSYDDAVTGHTFQPGLENQAWLCLDLLKILCQLSEMGHASHVLSVLEKPLNRCPEVLLLGMAHVNTAYSLIQNEVASAVVPMTLRNASGNVLMFNLWHVNPNMLLRGLVDAMNLDPKNVDRILDACEELKILSAVLDTIPFYFGICVASLASKKDIMDLENWLSTHLLTYKDSLYEECLKFLKDVQIGSRDISGNHFHSPGALLNIYLEAWPTILKVLHSHLGAISSSYLSEEIEKLDVSDMLINTIANVVSCDLTTSDNAVDIETELSQILHQMFFGDRSTDDMIQMLTRYKDSSDKREHLIYVRMIANLSKEFKFFMKYPDRQLRIASVLFGSLIKHQLVTNFDLGTALTAVLDSLRNPADTKMFSFGIKALEQFVDRLVEWPQYCNHILKISHLRDTHPELVAFVEKTLNRISASHGEPDIVHSVTSDHRHGPVQSSAKNVEIPGSSLSPIGPGTTHMGVQIFSPIQIPQRLAGSVDERKTSAILSNYTKPAQFSSGQPALAPSSDMSSFPKSHSGIGLPSASSVFSQSSRASSAGFGSALNIETLVAAAERRGTSIEAPASEIQDKISFIINNLAAVNIEAKAKEFTEILMEQYYPWFAQYMVMKRISMEANFQDLYVKFLEKVNLKPLDKEIVQATYVNCKVLLGSELIKSSADERSLLKNLGSWLGKITIGKNHFLRARAIDPISLITEAYEKGLMIAVIPFTSKILESCPNSLAFKLPNPWTMSILELLAEICAMPNLKMNLKFDIEVLFKKFSVDLKDVTRTSLLKDKIREVEGNPDFSNKDTGCSQPPLKNGPKDGIVSQPQYGRPLRPSGTLIEDEKLVSSGFPDQSSSAQGSLQGQTPFSDQLSVPVANIEKQVVVNKNLQAYGLHVHFQSILPISMGRAVKEVLSSIVQKNVSTAIHTTKKLVLKDYAMEPDDTSIRNAALLMVARLAGRLAYANCKETLRGSISEQLRSGFQGLSISSELLELAVQIVTDDNLELGCKLIEQAATEKAVQTIDVDGEIMQQLSIRRRHRVSVGPRYFDVNLYAQGQMDFPPEALRPRSGHLLHSQQGVYEDFTRFPGLNRSSQSADSVPVGGFPRQFVSATVSGQISPSTYASGLVNTELGAVSQALEIGTDGLDSVGARVLASVLSPDDSIGDGRQCLETDTVASFPPASSPDLGVMEPSNSVKLENMVANDAKEPEIQLASIPGSPESLQQLVEIVKNPAEATASSSVAVGNEDTTKTSRDMKAPRPPATSRKDYNAAKLVDSDPSGFHEQVSVLFSEWCQICDLPGENDAACACYVLHLQQRGLLKGDETSDRFFRRIMELSVSHCLSSEVINSSSSRSHQTHPLPFLAIDIYAKLVFSVLKFCPVDQGTNKLTLLHKVLAVTVKFIQHDSNEKKAVFNPRPYFRLFINWLLDLCSLEPVIDGGNFQVLTAFSNAFHAIHPLKVPGFSFAWLELVSHRSFMPKLLTANAQKGWPYFHRLLVDLFQFMEPFLRNAELGEPVHFLYKGTLRVLLVILHDFPEFLCNYHFSLCDVIPPSCIQMRNIILSAFPRNMRLPDPSTPNLKIDLLPEISQSPRILSEVDAALKGKQIKNDVDEYLKTRQQRSSFLAELKLKLLLSPTDAARAGTRYNVPLINSLVLYVGIKDIQHLQEKSSSHSQPMINMSTFMVSAALGIFQTLIKDLDFEGRYLFLNAVANQLRYPNNHTHYFSFILLYLFAESKQEVIQEQITRVLLERIIVNRPHPWGLLITFIELIKNPIYNFWSRSFTRRTPEIEKLFESVSRSCGGLKSGDE